MKANRQSATSERHWANDNTIQREMNVVPETARPSSLSDLGPQLVHANGAARATASFARKNTRPRHVHETSATRSFGLPFASVQEPRHGSTSFQMESDPVALEEHGHSSWIARRGLSRRNLALAFSYMEDNIGRKFRLDELARAVGVSRFHFSRLFRESTGKSPMGYLQCLRVDRAKEMLLQTDRSICDIAVSLGFFDQSHFTRTFRRFTALAPGEYVRMCDVAEVAM